MLSLSWSGCPDCCIFLSWWNLDLITCSSRHDVMIIIVIQLYFRNIALFGCSYSQIFPVKIFVVYCWIMPVFRAQDFIFLIWLSAVFISVLIIAWGGGGRGTSICQRWAVLRRTLSQSQLRPDQSSSSSLLPPELFSVRSLVRWLAPSLYNILHWTLYWPLYTALERQREIIMEIIPPVAKSSLSPGKTNIKTYFFQVNI